MFGSSNSASQTTPQVEDVLHLTAEDISIDLPVHCALRAQSIRPFLQTAFEGILGSLRSLEAASIQPHLSAICVDLIKPIADLMDDQLVTLLADEIKRYHGRGGMDVEGLSAEEAQSRYQQFLESLARKRS